MPALVAAALVFFCSACVLVLEILAGRLLAPYVGISLETYTSIIGTVLAGIAAGTWLGGRLADRVDPRRLLGPTIALGGLLSMFTVPVVRSLGNDTSPDSGRPMIVGLAFAGFFLPAFVLSAVHPMVVKLQLHDLRRTGRVVGRLSGVSTAGALVGTFVTGFLLVSAAPTSTIVDVLGGVLIALGAGFTLWLTRRASAVAVAIVVLGGAGLTVAAKAESPCDVESAYYCIRVERDPYNPSGRTLWLDDLRHSYVDLADPTDLQFTYIKSFAQVVASKFPDHRAIDALHIGGGGFTLPRYLRAEYPGTHSTVLEIDPEVLKIAREKLGLKTGPDLRVQVGDARIGIRDRATDSADLVVSDAFGSLSVPWHLATTEFIGQVQRVLRPGGVYVLNIIDYPPSRFARAELRTLQAHFPHVAVMAPSYVLDGTDGGNLVLVASASPIDVATLREQSRADGVEVLTGEALNRFVDGMPVITDDHAPVDQWLSQDRY
ncbi:MAG: fused MFS/spermidine synthase [Acidimicrobiia bacterium]